MRIVILGGPGMLGHKIVQALTARHSDTWWSVRSPKRGLRAAFLRSDRWVDGVDAADWRPLEALLKRLRPDVVVNCVGVIKQWAEA